MIFIVQRVEEDPDYHAVVDVSLHSTEEKAKNESCRNSINCWTRLVARALHRKKICRFRPLLNDGQRFEKMEAPASTMQTKITRGRSFATQNIL